MTAEHHDAVFDLIPAYALGSLDPEDLSLVEGHLPHCLVCRQELQAYRAVADRLPLASPEADPGAALKRRLMARIGTTARPVPIESHPEDVQSEAGLSLWNRLADYFRAGITLPRWTAAALALVLLVTAAGVIWLAQTSQPPAEIALRGTEAAPDAVATIVLSEDGQLATLIVEGLPPLDPDHQYQLWLIDADGSRLSGAVFSTDEDGYVSEKIEPPRALQSFASFGVTIEPAGGSPGPTGDQVLEYIQ